MKIRYRTDKLGKYVRIRTGKLDANAGDPRGIYPFFTCAEKPLRINSYSFDCECILVAGNGDLNVKYYNGKFDVYQRTYVIESLDKSELDIRYLFHFMSEYVKKLRDMSIGGVIKYIKLNYLTDAEIPLPSLIEQRRIAAILDKADDIRFKRLEFTCLRNEFLCSVFFDMFGDPVTNPKEWDKAPIKNLGFVTTGNTPSREHPEYYGEGIEWIKSDNINTPYHFLTKAKEFLTPEGQKIGRIVPENSVLVTCIAGSPDCIGNAALADRPVAFNQQINAVTPFESTDPFFLYVHFLISKNLVQQQSTESMKGMVNKSKFENILFFKPPYSLQYDFGKIFNRIHNIFSKHNNAMSLSEDLFNALTQKAFRGEL